MGIIERILQITECYGISVNEFSKSVGVSNGYFAKQRANNANVGSRILEKIVRRYPEIDTSWLLTGEGEIFKTKSTKKAINANDGNFDGLFDGKRKVQKTPSNTPSKKIVRDLAESLSDKLKGSSGGYIEVPLVDIEAAAGGGAPNADFIEEAENIRFPLSLLHHATGKLLCINVVGESMEPTLFDGSLVVIRLIDRSQWGSIRSGDVYVITDREGATYIKRVRNKLRSQGVLIMTSDNPDQRRYKPFERAEDEILNVWAVELVISNNIPPSDREIDDLRDQIDDLRTMIERLVDREN